MDLEDLLDDLRRKVDDTAHPQLYSDSQLTDWLNDAVEEVCIRTRCLQDSSSAVCSVAVEEDERSIALDPSIFVVRSARIDGQARRLELKNSAWLDENYPGWDDDALTITGVPQYAVFDTDQHTLQVYPTPDDDYTLKLRVWRGAIDDEKLESESDVPIIPERYHRHLALFAAGLAFDDKDSEKYDPERADRLNAKFDTYVGPPVSAQALRLMGTSRIRGVKAHFV